MLSRSALARNAHNAVRRSCSVQPRRAFAAVAATGAFETSEVNGLKVASRDAHDATTKLAVIAKAGTRYQPLPGLTVGLEEFAFKTTQRRTALRLARESELLGGQLRATHTREAIILEANFLREDLPYFTELLAEVISMTKYTTHEFHEEVERVLPLKQAAFNADVDALALDNAHTAAFHTGLGSAIYPTLSSPFRKYLNEEHIASYADVAYTRSNIAVVADGAAPEALSMWVDKFFQDVPATPATGSSLQAEASKYYGGEQRTPHNGGNSMVIAFPGSDHANPKPEIAVLAALIGGQTTIKWSPGFSLLSKSAIEYPGLTISAKNIAHSDAGLFTIQLSGNAASIRKAAADAVKALENVANGSVSKEDVTKAVANAKFDALEAFQLRGPTMLLAGSSIVNNGKAFDQGSFAKSIDGVNADKLKTTAKALLDGKASVSAVGDTFVLPFAEEIGLRV